MIVVRLLFRFALLTTPLFALLVWAPHLAAQRASLPEQETHCAAPCWQDFQPGITTYEQASTLFNGTGWVLDDTYCQQISSSCSVFAWGVPGQPDRRAGGVFLSGRLDAIAFQKPGLTLGDLLLALGEPDHIDQYKSFDTTGVRFIIYTAHWEMIELQIRLDCPGDFALLLLKSASVITLSADGYIRRMTTLADPRAFSHSRRQVCRL